MRVVAPPCSEGIMAKQCLKITVTGTVQNASYRLYVKKQAEKLSIEGTVQNAETGGVIIFACSSTDTIDAFIDALYDGPSEAQVESVAAEPLMLVKDFRGVFRAIGEG